MSFWAFVFPFDPPNNPKNQNFEKINKCQKILPFYTYVSQITVMMYLSWYIRQNISRQNFFVILAYFLPFYPPNNPKNKNFEKNEKSTWRYYYLHKCTINENHMIHGSWDINCNRQICFVIFGHFFSFYPLNSPKKENIKKVKKTPGDIIILH